jgi:hypothetical protein
LVDCHVKKYSTAPELQKEETVKYRLDDRKDAYPKVG